MNMSSRTWMLENKQGRFPQERLVFTGAAAGKDSAWTSVC